MEDDRRAPLNERVKNARVLPYIARWRGGLRTVSYQRRRSRILTPYWCPIEGAPVQAPRPGKAGQSRPKPPWKLKLGGPNRNDGKSSGEKKSGTCSDTSACGTNFQP